PDHRDRRAELVSRVVDEATLRGKRLLEPVEHLVEGPGEATDLVVTLHWYPLAQIGFGDVERGLADETDRPQHVPGGDPGDHGREHEDRSEDHRRDPDHVVDDLL